LQIPLPVIVNKKIHFDPAALTACEGFQSGRKLGGVIIAYHQEGRVTAFDFQSKVNASLAEALFLNRRPSCVVLGETVDRYFFYTQCAALVEQGEPGCNAILV